MQEATKEYCALVVNHALSKAYFEGKTQKDVADEINVDPAGLSRAKKGNQNLGITAINTLIDLFGAPKVSEGLYLEAIVLEDFSQFKLLYQSIHDDIFNKELVAWFNHEKIKNKTFKLLAPYYPYKYPSQSRFPSIFDKEEPSEAVKLWVDEFIRSPEFLTWVREAVESIKFVKSENDMEPRFAINDLEFKGVNHWVSDEDKASLLNLGYLIENLEPNYSLFTSSVYQPKFSVSEVVLTGSLVDESIDDRCNQARQIKSPLGFIFSGEDFPEHRHGKPNKYRKIQQFNLVNSAYIDLYLNEKMEYRLRIFESTSRYSNSYVIKNVHGAELFDIYNQLREFYFLPQSDLKSLKSSLAEKGGYIPGALVL
ncbi:hypothetical protein ACFSJY_02715 [Thalassotalea euphylliae]|uniref:hypothetical protein n=1 Tax=Thalassotalea euphylliae TaxID=1655234 RepID=UPI0036400BD1